MNFYEVLNISTKATEKDIKKAYRLLAKKYHPDTYDGDKAFAEDKMQEINIAYDTLSNSTSRKEYDEKLGINIVSDFEEAYSPNTAYSQKKYKSTYSNPYNKSGVNYEVRYRPNNSKIKYDSNGYAESNYYTSEKTKSWKFDRYSFGKRIKEKLTKKNIIIISCILFTSIILCTLAINQAIKNMNEFFNSTKGVYDKINSVKIDNNKKYQEEDVNLKEELLPIIENTVNNVKTEGEELLNKFEQYKKENKNKNKKDTLNEWGITSPEDQEAILKYLEQFN